MVEVYIFGAMYCFYYILFLVFTTTTSQSPFSLPHSVFRIPLVAELTCLCYAPPHSRGLSLWLFLLTSVVIPPPLSLALLLLLPPPPHSPSHIYKTTILTWPSSCGIHRGKYFTRRIGNCTDGLGLSRLL
ncbi:hypothetical protein EJ06DRAFT_401167 [Trichodelitschia bisporula]|uniref:Uncharacterized protein n=1 Tax=Trichodelitschia bisporula TaxID=703511 RepID=A0A6G1HXJ5_9PEZI|nr:hypothetical protein EJ06DRAFT_401167 [Trichodelitschia bisporula]